MEQLNRAQFNQGEKRPLPQGWRWVRLGDHVTKVGSGITPRGGQASYQKSGIPLIRSQNVHMNRFVTNGIAFISFEQDKQMEGSRVLSGDILLNITGASIGRVCVVPEVICPANVNQHVSIIRGDGSFEPAFVSYFISRADFQKRILDSQAGATRQALTKTLIEDFRIPLPPLTEQKRIAALLNEQMATVERARDSAESQLEAAKALPSAYLRAVFNSPEAQKWPKRIIGDLCYIKGGKRLPSGTGFTPYATFYPYIRVVDFVSGGVKLRDLKYVDEQTHHQIHRYIINHGDVYISIAGTIGLVGVIPVQLDGAHLTENAARLVIKNTEELDRDFLARYLQSPLGQHSISKRTNIVGQPKLALERIATLKVPLAPIETQRTIVALFDKQMKESQGLIKALEEILNEINALPAALLRRAFIGEI